MSVRDCVLGSGIVPLCALLGANSGNPCLTPRSAGLRLERQTERGIDSISRFPIQALVHSWPSRWAQVGLILARRFSRLLRLDGLLADRGAVGLPEWAAVRVTFFHRVVPKTGHTPSLQSPEDGEQRDLPPLNEDHHVVGSEDPGHQHGHDDPERHQQEDHPEEEPPGPCQASVSAPS